ncbi:MAG: hypothetical protein DRJ11_01965 [Candidatus Aminicenantes bacterium]|nr:MAG: hypothetical protein DRJ11_01965 [Candidatus Aminicenantes bacterium]
MSFPFWELFRPRFFWTPASSYKKQSIPPKSIGLSAGFIPPWPLRFYYFPLLTITFSCLTSISRRFLKTNPPFALPTKSPPPPHPGKKIDFDGKIILL